MNLGRSNTDHKELRNGEIAVRPLTRRTLTKYMSITCQICTRHSCSNPDCDSSIDSYIDSEHFGVRCATCWISRADPPLFYTSINACERIERTFRERYGPDYKDDDPEVESGLYEAGEHRYRSNKRSEYFCESSWEAWSRNGETVWGPYSKRVARWASDTVRFRPGNTPITWYVCDACKEPVYKSIRRYTERLYKEYKLREKEYYLQRAALRMGGETLREIKRHLKNRTPASR